MTKTVRCPECGKDAVYSSENEFRPFCSERCRLLDLGEWANEKYRVASEEERPSEEELEKAERESPGEY